MGCTVFSLGKQTIVQLLYRTGLVWECNKNIKSPFSSPQLQLFPFCPLCRGFPRGISAHSILDTGDTKDRNRLILHLLEWVGVTDISKVTQVLRGLDHSWDVLIFLQKLKSAWGDSQMMSLCWTCFIHSWKGDHNWDGTWWLLNLGQGRRWGEVEVGFFCYWKPYFYSVVWERKGSDGYYTQLKHK